MSCLESFTCKLPGAGQDEQTVGSLPAPGDPEDGFCREEVSAVILLGLLLLMCAGCEHPLPLPSPSQMGPKSLSGVPGNGELWPQSKGQRKKEEQEWRQAERRALSLQEPAAPRLPACCPAGLSLRNPHLVGKMALKKEASDPVPLLGKQEAQPN